MVELGKWEKLTLTTSYNLESPGKSPNEGLSTLSGLWVFFWGCVFIDVGRPIPLWVAPFSKQGVLDCVRVKK